MVLETNYETKRSLEGNLTPKLRQMNQKDIANGADLQFAKRKPKVKMGGNDFGLDSLNEFEWLHATAI